MDNSVTKLIRVLETMLERHKSLLKLCHEQKQALIDNDILRLERVVGKMNQLTDEIGQLEEKRVETVREVASILGVKQYEKSDLDTLVTFIHDEITKRQFVSIRSELKEVMCEIQTTNELIAKLTHQSLDYTSKFMSFVSSVLNGNVRYGSAKTSSAGGHFINLQT